LKQCCRHLLARRWHIMKLWITVLVMRKRNVFKRAPADGRSGSNVYELNQWLWQFERCKPHLGGLTLEEITRRRTLGARNESSVQWRLFVVGKRIGRDSNEECLWLMYVQYVPVCISIFQQVPELPELRHVSILTSSSCIPCIRPVYCCI
jgi:hypothetical protein